MNPILCLYSIHFVAVNSRYHEAYDSGRGDRDTFLDCKLDAGGKFSSRITKAASSPSVMLPSIRHTPHSSCQDLILASPDKDLADSMKLLREAPL
jgi:hypothetical protein